MTEEKIIKSVRKPNFSIWVHNVFASELDYEFPIWGIDRHDKRIKLGGPEIFYGHTEDTLWENIQKIAFRSINNHLFRETPSNVILGVRYSYTKTGQKYMRYWLND